MKSLHQFKPNWQRYVAMFSYDGNQLYCTLLTPHQSLSRINVMAFSTFNTLSSSNPSRQEIMSRRLKSSSRFMMVNAQLMVMNQGTSKQSVKNWFPWPTHNYAVFYSDLLFTCHTKVIEADSPSQGRRSTERSVCSGRIQYWPESQFLTQHFFLQTDQQKPQKSKLHISLCDLQNKPAKTLKNWVKWTPKVQERISSNAALLYTRHQWYRETDKDNFFISVMYITSHLDLYLNNARTLSRWLKPLGVLLHNPAVYFYRAPIHIMVSQWIPRGGSDVWGILKKVREFSTNETMCKNKTWRAE